MGQHMPNRIITFTLMLKFQADDCWGEAPECQRGKERVIGSSGFRSFPQILCWYRKGMSLSAHKTERRQEKCGATATLFSVTWRSDGIGRGSGVDKDVEGFWGLSGCRPPSQFVADRWRLADLLTQQSWTDRGYQYRLSTRRQGRQRLCGKLVGRDSDTPA